MPNDFRALELARAIVDEVHALCLRPALRLLHVDQLLESSESITANMREAWGRKQGRERNQFLRYAKGSAEETDERLRTNRAAGRLPERTFWRLRNRLVVLRKMIEKLMEAN